MEIIVHRVNTIKELDNLPTKYGVEIDLRDSLNGRIYLQHDPFTPGEDFITYLEHYHHGTMILDIKSERIEYKALELLRRYGIKKYFFLDCSFPMIKALSVQGERNIAVRLSEYEGMDTVRQMRGRVGWVWVDCFSKYPLDDQTYSELKNMGFKLCVVSPELEARKEDIKESSLLFKSKYIADAVCTDPCFIADWE